MRIIWVSSALQYHSQQALFVLKQSMFCFIIISLTLSAFRNFDISFRPIKYLRSLCRRITLKARISFCLMILLQCPKLLFFIYSSSDCALNIETLDFFAQPVLHLDNACRMLFRSTILKKFLQILVAFLSSHLSRAASLIRWNTSILSVRRAMAPITFTDIFSCRIYSLHVPKMLRFFSMQVLFQTLLKWVSNAIWKLLRRLSRSAIFSFKLFFKRSVSASCSASSHLPWRMRFLLLSSFYPKSFFKSYSTILLFVSAHVLKARAKLLWFQ